MRSRYVAVLAICAVVVVLAACNAILGNEASITYVDGDAIAGPDREAAADDVAADGTAAPGDAADAGDLPPNPDVPCDAAAFCADFDPPSATIPYGWREARPNDASVFHTDNVFFVTPPNGLRVSLFSGETSRWLATDIDGGRPFDFFVDVNLPSVGTGTIQILQIACHPSATLRIAIDQSGGLSLSDTQGTVLGPVLPFGQWVRFGLRISATDTVLRLSGPLAASVSLPRSCLGPFTVSMGVIVPSGAASSWTILFDRVRATVP